LFAVVMKSYRWWRW